MLLSLPEELTIEALCSSDVSTVISASQVNTTLRRIAFTHSVWVSLVENLRYTGFIDGVSAQELLTMSTHQLVALVRRLVLGPDSWSPPARIASVEPRVFSKLRQKIIPASSSQSTVVANPTHTARLRTRIVLHQPRSTLPLDPLFTPHDFVLLPGGEYVLLKYATDIGCWRVSDEELVWRYSSQATGALERLMFAADVVNGGNEVNIVICSNKTPDMTVSWVEVVNLNFVTGISQRLFQAQLNDLGFSYRDCAQIWGGLAILPMRPIRGTHTVLVFFDWLSHLYCQLEGPHDSRFTLNLVADYLLSVNMESHSTYKIELRALTALANLWCPVSSAGVLHNSVPVNVESIPACISRQLLLDDGRVCLESPLMVNTSVHKSPLARDAFRVWISLYDELEVIQKQRLSRFRLASGSARAETRAVPRTRLLDVRLCLSSAEPQLYLRNREPAELRPAQLRNSFAYAGHSIGGRNDGDGWRWVFLAKEREGYVELALPANIQRPWISPYSGVLTYAFEDKVAIEYFE